MQYQTKKVVSALWCAVVAGGISIAVIAPASAQKETAKVAKPAVPAKAPAPAKSTPVKSTPALPASTVVATVNGEKILMSSISQVLDKIKVKATIPQEDLDKMRDEILEDLIIERLMVQEAKKLNLIPPKEKIEDAIWDLQRPFSSPKAFQEALAKQGKTEADLRLVFSEDMMITAFSKQTTKGIIVTDDEVTQYYNEHKDEFLVPEMVHVRHIQVSVKDDAPPAEREKAKKQAADLLKKASAGNADFAELAKKNSKDIVSAPAGGDLGFLARDDVMDKAFGDAVFSAPPGKVYSKVVETKFGYKILKIEEKRPSRTLTLAEVGSSIKPRLLQKKFKTRMDAKVAELRKAAVITNIFAQNAA